MINKKGLLTELKFEQAAVEAGWTVLKPLSVERFDYVIKKGINFLKIQVKSAYRRKNRPKGYSMSVATYSNFKGERNTYTCKEVDYFATNINNEWIFISPKQIKAKSGLSIATDSIRFKKFLRFKDILKGDKRG